MQKRSLGRSGIEVAPLAFGGNVFGWTADERTSFELLDGFVDAGFNLIDTADAYSRWVPGNQGGESETIIGNWLKRSGKRDRIVLATKLGLELGVNKTGIAGLSPHYMVQAVEDSLRRLQTDYIDLYQAHRDDPNTPMEETLQAFAKLIQQGKVRVIGASNFSAERLEQALRVSRENGLPRYESLQPEYNLCERKQFEAALEPLCVKEEIGVISYYSVASGFLTGKYRSETDLPKTPRRSAASKYMNERGFGILHALDQVAAKHHATPVQVALAWLLTRPAMAAPIASATSVSQLKELLQGTRLTLDAESVALLNQASS